MSSTPIYSDQWLKDATGRIKSLSLKESTKVAASYLTDIWDELAVKRNREDLVGSYDEMIDEELSKIDLGLFEDGNLRGALWTTGKTILITADEVDYLQDYAFRISAHDMFRNVIEHFRDEFPPDAKTDDMIRGVFCMVLNRQHTWFQAEISKEKPIPDEGDGSSVRV